MENTLVGEENDMYIEKINNINCLRYKEKYSGDNFLKNPTFKKWLNGEINKKGTCCYLYKCKNCNCFSYIKYDEKEVKCCKNAKHEYICKYCGNIFFGASYCCIKNGFSGVFGEYLLDGYYNCRDLHYYCKALPLFFQLIFIGSIVYALFLH